MQLLTYRDATKKQSDGLFILHRYTDLKWKNEADRIKMSILMSIKKNKLSVEKIQEAVSSNYDVTPKKLANILHNMEMDSLVIGRLFYRPDLLPTYASKKMKKYQITITEVGIGVKELYKKYSGFAN